MKTLMVLTGVCLILCVVLSQTDASPCRVIRFVRCFFRLINGKWYRVCFVYYRRVCPGKRDQIEDSQERVTSTSKRPEKAIIEKFPSKFSTYDKDGDNSISFDEFQTTLGDVHDNKMLRKLFHTTDKNGDNAITCDEFLKAKFDFSEKPVCQ